MTNDFDKFRLPLGVTKGVEIPLKGTKAVFTVMLPSSNNEDFTMALMVKTNVQADDENVSFDVTPARFVQMKKELFFEICILSAEGIPPGLSLGEFFAEYPLAAKMIYLRAQEMANKADKEVQEALGNFVSTPSGVLSGAEKKTSTTSPKKAGSTSRPESLN